MQPYQQMWLSAGRLGVALFAGALLLPLFSGLEWLLRRPGRGGWIAPALAKLLLLVGLGVGVGTGVLSSAVGMALPLLLLLFPLFELVCWRVYRATPNPWLTGLVQSGWLGWCLGALYPLS